MNRILSALIAGLVLTVTSLMSAGSQAQTSQSPSLGDYARAIKKTKPEPQKSAPKVYDNDNLPRNTSLSVVGKESEPAPEVNSADKDKISDSTTNSDEKGKDSNKSEESPEIKPGQSPEERQKAVDSWKQKISDQKTKVDLLGRELNVLQREYQIKVSEFYSNTAMRAQNPNAIMEDDAKYKKEIADKQQALDDAKSKLDELEEKAHKAGAPNSATE
jgi:hypothetical protein